MMKYMKICWYFFSNLGRIKHENNFDQSNIKAQIRGQMSGPEILHDMENQFWAVGCGLGWTMGKTGQGRL